MDKKILYVDMDDVIADFYSAAKDQDENVQEYLMWTPGFFGKLKPTEGSQWAVAQLEKRYDVYILSQPLAGHAESYSDKAEWINKHFPSLYNKLILTQDKGLNIGDILIDDNKLKWKEKFEKNGGTFIHFPYGGYNKACRVGTKHIWDLILRGL